MAAPEGLLSQAGDEIAHYVEVLVGADLLVGILLDDDAVILEELHVLTVGNVVKRTLIVAGLLGSLLHGGLLLVVKLLPGLAADAKRHGRVGMSGQRQVLLHLVHLRGDDLSQSVLLSVDGALLERGERLVG